MSFTTLRMTITYAKVFLCQLELNFMIQLLQEFGSVGYFKSKSLVYCYQQLELGNNFYLSTKVY